MCVCGGGRGKKVVKTEKHNYLILREFARSVIMTETLRWNEYKAPRNHKRLRVPQTQSFRKKS